MVNFCKLVYRLHWLDSNVGAAMFTQTDDVLWLFIREVEWV